MRSNTKFGLAHHWLVESRGGEKVLRQLIDMFPGTDIYTLVCGDIAKFPFICEEHVRTSFLQYLPAAANYYKMLMGLFPAAVASLKVSRDTEVLISSDSAVMKGLRVPPNCIHVCYCHSPPRYLWEMGEDYIKYSSNLGIISKLFFRLFTPFVRRFDYMAAQSVDSFIANSEFVARRIMQYYGKESVVINPPVELDRFQVGKKPRDHFLIVSELVPYKRIDVAVEAFNDLNDKLLIVGDGSEYEGLKRRAASNIEFLGRVSDRELPIHYQSAKALVFPGIEDFGITPLEAQACGTPVVGLAKGGLLETVIHKKTGILYKNADSGGLREGILQFKRHKFSEAQIRANVERYSEERFQQKISSFLDELIK